MTSFRFAALGVVLISLLVKSPLFLFQPPESSAVEISVFVDEEPADAMIRIFQNGQFVRVVYTDVHTRGLARFELPEGNYLLRVEHGAGYTALPVEREIAVPENTLTTAEIDIQKLLEPNEHSYYSADLHIHTAASAPAMERDFGILNHGVTPVDQVVGIQLGADLDLMFISDHNSTDGHELFMETSEERGVPYLLSEEITTIGWGHYNPISLNPGEVVEFGFSKLPTAYFEESRANGAAFIQINHPLSSFFGYFFTQNQSAYDPNFDGVEVFNGNFGEDDRQTVLRMFDYWNQGVRHVATAVSDDHDWLNLGGIYGTPRTYVYVEDAFTAESFLDSLIAGRAFVSYGPHIYLMANGDATPGNTIEINSGDEISFQLELESVHSLDGVRAEVIRSGARVQTFEPSGTQSTFTWAEALENDTWIAVRLIAPDGKHLALTNPIWVSVH